MVCSGAALPLAGPLSQQLCLLLAASQAVAVAVMQAGVRVPHHPTRPHCSCSCSIQAADRSTEQPREATTIAAAGPSSTRQVGAAAALPMLLQQPLHLLTQQQPGVAAVAWYSSSKVTARACTLKLLGDPAPLAAVQTLKPGQAPGTRTARCLISSCVPCCLLGSCLLLACLLLQRTRERLAGALLCLPRNVSVAKPSPNNLGPAGSSITRTHQQHTVTRSVCTCVCCSTLTSCLRCRCCWLHIIPVVKEHVPCTCTCTCACVCLQHGCIKVLWVWGLLLTLLSCVDL